ncbi:hypothetical protein PMG11_02871 [Penicillium brasilianum]|uniref:AT hook motif protein n=1 Tax=Penicillium brasilianum TaxID=104259 RepID=A0A0F7TML8_PENBI|nr:hypothetical protein PMG11_02871 [Penicillium brasilianum]
MRWDTSADQLLLLKIVETHDISVDTNKVAAAWPVSPDGQPGPTARAIKERIGKLRELARRSGTPAAAGASPKRGRAKKATAPKADSDSQSPSTPAKRKRKSTSNAEQEPRDDGDVEAKMEQLIDYPAEPAHAEDTGHMSHENDNFFDENA